MATQDERNQQFSIVQKEQSELFVRKNIDYGDAFATYGTVGVLVRMGDKIQRCLSIEKSGVIMVEEEKMRETIIDLGNYCILALMLIDEGDKVKLNETGVHETKMYESDSVNTE